MTIANVSQRRDSGLPQALRTAQEAIHLPEVQEMLRRLAEYRLGIFMPHMHDEHTGEFRDFPMKSCRWNLVWKCPSSQWKKSQTRQIAFSLWDGFGVPVHQPPRQCAKWFREKKRTGTELPVTHKMRKGNEWSASSGCTDPQSVFAYDISSLEHSELAK